MTAHYSWNVARYGWLPDLPDHRDHLYEQTTPEAKLPFTADLTANMPPVYDQGQLGNCTGNGIAAVLEFREMMQFEGTHTPSRLFIYYEERVIEGTVASDSGAQIRDGIKVVAGKGAPPETDWPYDIARFAEKPPAKAYADAVKHEAIKYQRVIPGRSWMRSAIAGGNPIVFGFSVPASFEDGSWDPSSELLPLPAPDEQIISGHCCVIVGYDYSRKRFSVPAFKIRNSWGSSWGDQGYFWMSADWFTSSLGLADDLWIISKAT